MRRVRAGVTGRTRQPQYPWPGAWQGSAQPTGVPLTCFPVLS